MTAITAVVVERDVPGTCPAVGVAEYQEGRGLPLVCDLDARHEGDHHDPWSRVTWQFIEEAGVAA